jgi:hypothetical protein
MLTVHMGAIARRVARGGTYTNSAAAAFNGAQRPRELVDSTVRRWRQETGLGVSAPAVFTIEKGRDGYVRYFGIGEAGSTALGMNQEAESILIVWRQGTQAYVEVGEHYALGNYPGGVFPDALLNPEAR